jgi:hypothetical protein
VSARTLNIANGAYGFNALHERARKVEEEP